MTIELSANAADTYYPNPVNIMLTDSLTNVAMMNTNSKITSPLTSQYNQILLESLLLGGYLTNKADLPILAPNLLQHTDFGALESLNSNNPLHFNLAQNGSSNHPLNQLEAKILGWGQGLFVDTPAKMIKGITGLLQKGVAAWLDIFGNQLPQAAGLSQQNWVPWAAAEINQVEQSMVIFLEVLPNLPQVLQNHFQTLFNTIITLEQRGDYASAARLRGQLAGDVAKVLFVVGGTTNSLVNGLKTVQPSVVKNNIVPFYRNNGGGGSYGGGTPSGGSATLMTKPVISSGVTSVQSTATQPAIGLGLLNTPLHGITKGLILLGSDTFTPDTTPKPVTDKTMSLIDPRVIRPSAINSPLTIRQDSYLPIMDFTQHSIFYPEIPQETLQPLDRAINNARIATRDFEKEFKLHYPSISIMPQHDRSSSNLNGFVFNQQSNALVDKGNADAASINYKISGYYLDKANNNISVPISIQGSLADLHKLLVEEKGVAHLTKMEIHLDEKFGITPLGLKQKNSQTVSLPAERSLQQTLDDAQKEIERINQALKQDYPSIDANSIVDQGNQLNSMQLRPPFGGYVDYIDYNNSTADGIQDKSADLNEPLENSRDINFSSRGNIGKTSDMGAISAGQHLTIDKLVVANMPDEMNAALKKIGNDFKQVVADRQLQFWDTENPLRKRLQAILQQLDNIDQLDAEALEQLIGDIIRYFPELVILLQQKLLAGRSDTNAEVKRIIKDYTDQAKQGLIDLLLILQQEGGLFGTASAANKTDSLKQLVAWAKENSANPALSQFASLFSLLYKADAAVNISSNELADASFSNANLSNLDLTGLDLQGEEFKGADLSYAKMSGMNLAQINFAKANMTNADLSQANLASANLSSVNLSEANLSQANLDGANFVDANLNYINLSSAHLHGTNLSKVSLIDANLSGTDLEGANFSGANLEGANLSGANLKRANFSYANLVNAKFERMELPMPDNSPPGYAFKRANLTSTNFADANLREVTISDAIMKSTNLERANLGKANLSDIDFTTANLKLTNFNDTDLTKVNFFDPGKLSGKVRNAFISFFTNPGIKQAAADIAKQMHFNDGSLSTDLRVRVILGTANRIPILSDVLPGYGSAMFALDLQTVRKLMESIADGTMVKFLSGKMSNKEAIRFGLDKVGCWLALGTLHDPLFAKWGAGTFRDPLAVIREDNNPWQNALTEIIKRVPGAEALLQGLLSLGDMITTKLPWLDISKLATPVIKQPYNELFLDATAMRTGGVKYAAPFFPMDASVADAALLERLIGNYAGAIEAETTGNSAGQITPHYKKPEKLLLEIDRLLQSLYDERNVLRQENALQNLSQDKMERIGKLQEKIDALQNSKVKAEQLVISLQDSKNPIDWLKKLISLADKQFTNVLQLNVSRYDNQGLPRYDVFGIPSDNLYQLNEDLIISAIGETSYDSQIGIFLYEKYRIVLDRHAEDSEKRRMINIPKGTLISAEMLFMINAQLLLESFSLLPFLFRLPEDLVIEETDFNYRSERRVLDNKKTAAFFNKNDGLEYQIWPALELFRKGIAEADDKIWEQSVMSTIVLGSVEIAILKNYKEKQLGLVNEVKNADNFKPYYSLMEALLPKFDYGIANQTRDRIGLDLSNPIFQGLDIKIQFMTVKRPAKPNVFTDRSVEKYARRFDENTPYDAIVEPAEPVIAININKSNDINSYVIPLNELNLVSMRLSEDGQRVFQKIENPLQQQSNDEPRLTMVYTATETRNIFRESSLQSHMMLLPTAVLDFLQMPIRGDFYQLTPEQITDIENFASAVQGTNLAGALRDISRSQKLFKTEADFRKLGDNLFEALQENNLPPRHIQRYIAEEFGYREKVYEHKSPVQNVQTAFKTLQNKAGALLEVQNWSQALQNPDQKINQFLNMMQQSITNLGDELNALLSAFRKLGQGDVNQLSYNIGKGKDPFNTLPENLVRALKQMVPGHDRVLENSQDVQQAMLDLIEQNKAKLTNYLFAISFVLEEISPSLAKLPTQQIDLLGKLIKPFNLESFAAIEENAIRDLITKAEAFVKAVIQELNLASTSIVAEQISFSEEENDGRKFIPINQFDVSSYLPIEASADTPASARSLPISLVTLGSYEHAVNLVKEYYIKSSEHHFIDSNYQNVSLTTNQIETYLNNFFAGEGDRFLLPEAVLISELEQINGIRKIATYNLNDNRKLRLTQTIPMRIDRNNSGVQPVMFAWYQDQVMHSDDRRLALQRADELLAEAMEGFMLHQQSRATENTLWRGDPADVEKLLEQFWLRIHSLDLTDHTGILAAQAQLHAALGLLGYDLPVNKQNISLAIKVLTSSHAEFIADIQHQYGIKLISETDIKPVQR